MGNGSRGADVGMQQWRLGHFPQVAAYLLRAADRIHGVRGADGNISRRSPLLLLPEASAVDKTSEWSVTPPQREPVFAMELYCLILPLVPSGLHREAAAGARWRSAGGQQPEQRCQQQQEGGSVWRDQWQSEIWRN